MRIISGTIRGTSRLARFKVELSKKLDKDSNGLTITGLVVMMPGLPADILILAHRPFAVGRGAMTPGI